MVPKRKASLENIFENEAEKQDYKIQILSEKFEDHTIALKEEIRNFKTRLKEFALCIEELEGLSKNLPNQIKRQIKEESQTLSDTLNQTMEKSFSVSENKIQRLIQDSKELFQKNRRHANKQHWLMVGAFGMGCLLLSLGLSSFFIHQNIARVDLKTLDLSYIGETFTAARSKMNKQERAKLRKMLSDAVKKKRS